MKATCVEDGVGAEVILPVPAGTVAMVVGVTPATTLVAAGAAGAGAVPTMRAGGAVVEAPAAVATDGVEKAT